MQVKTMRVSFFIHETDKGLKNENAQYGRRTGHLTFSYITGGIFNDIRK